MSSHPKVHGAQDALLLLVFLLAIGGLGGVFFWMQSGVGAWPEGASLTPSASLLPSATQWPTLTPSETPTPSPSPTATPSPTPLDPLSCLAPDAPRAEGQVSAVVSGSVIEVKEGGRRYFVRYLGVDPVGDGQASAAFNRQLVEGQRVTLVSDLVDVDERGNRLRYVLAGEVFVNFEMIRQGLALPGFSPPAQACQAVLLAAEALARQEKLGYWGLAEGTPMLPGATLPEAGCDCAVRYTCADFSSQSAAQACYNACGDYRNTGLDPDHNGLACDE